MDYYSSLLKPLLFSLDAETAHNAAIKALKYHILPKPKVEKYPRLNTNVFGINFDNPIGMAAGFDKNAMIFNELYKFGFGFVECGTVTPRPQKGNSKPRIFRLEEDEAIVNCLGFNNQGIHKFLKNTNELQKSGGILGINIGKNKDTKNAIDDYLFLLDKAYGQSNYITINISSPNTKNLRELQKSNILDIFLKEIMLKKAQLVQEYNKNIPILLKIAPDLSLAEQKEISKLSLKHGIDGLIISNTTISRNNKLRSHNIVQSGGLSGKPLLNQSNLILKNIYNFTEKSIPIIGVGGVSSALDAYEKIKLGASLIQIYSAFIYQGFGLVERIKKDLNDLLEKDGFNIIKDAVGQHTKKL